MKEKDKRKSKQQIQSLAELCINKIYENKFLTDPKERYTNQINLIKKIFMKNSKLVNDNKLNKSDLNIILIDEIKNFYNSLISSNFELKKEEKKFQNKYNNCVDEILKEDSMNKQLLSNIQYDNFILLYQLKEKDDIINKLNEALESIKKNIYFKETKREFLINKSNKWGDYYLNVNINNLSEKMMGECQNFILYNNKYEKKAKEKININKKIELYKDLIKYYKNYLDDSNLNINNSSIKNKNKKFSEDKNILTKSIYLPNDNKLSLFENEDNILDDNLKIDEEKKKNDDNHDNIIINEKKLLHSTCFIDENNYKSLFDYNNNQENYKNKNNNNTKKSSKSIRNFLTVDELFDINNHEGKSEAIIDDELHSDDETTFEIKVKPLKKITIHYIPKIKKQVPKINLAQIEFNKQKVMNEADLYSLQRRKFKMQNLDENIKTMKKKIKKLKHLCKLNKKKLAAFENYAKNIENNYKALKPLKIQSSLGGAKIPKIQKFFFDDNTKNGKFNEIEDIDLGDSDLEDDDTYDIGNTETNVDTKISISDTNNIIVKNKYLENIINKDNNLKSKESGKKLNHFNKTSVRAKSK